MSNTYTFEDVQYLFHEELTPAQEAGVVTYINTGKIPPADPCLSCEPNVVRRYIGRVQAAERAGTWPPKNRIKLVQEFVPGVVDTENPVPPVSEIKERPKPRAKGK